MNNDKLKNFLKQHDNYKGAPPPSELPQIENKLPKRSPFVLWGSFAAVAIAIALVFVNLSPQKETPQVSDAELAQFLFSDDYFSENGDDIGNEYLEIIDL